jgi:hypothetical protein
METVGLGCKDMEHGCVTVSRLRTTIVALVALAGFALATAAPAVAGSLLSGYGGPGQGSQAILGSELLNSPDGGGGSNGAGSSGSSASAQSAAGTPGTGTGARTRTSPGAARSRATAKPSPRKQGEAEAGRSQSQSSSRAGAPATAALAQSASVSSPTLGLSGADLLYVLIALGALVSTAALTRRFARPRG